jgi:hypothetical protein
MRNGLRLIGGTSFQVIDAPPDAVWRAVMDIGRWTHFVPQAVETRSVSRRGHHQTVFVRHVQGPVDASYYLRLQAANETRMARFRVDGTRPHDIREGWGFFIVAPFGETKSMVTFGVMADVGSGLITGLVRPRVHEWMLRIPDQLKEWVEGSGRRHYVGS